MGGPGHYVVTPTRVEVELRLSWAVTIYEKNTSANFPHFEDVNLPLEIKLDYNGL